MKILAAIALVITAMPACSSPAPVSASCPVAGTYLVSYERDASNPGKCSFPNGLHPDTVTVSFSGGQASVFTQGEEGTCAGTVDSSCRLSCTQMLAHGDTLQLSWSFDATGVHGGDAMAFASTACDANWNISGSRK